MKQEPKTLVGERIGRLKVIQEAEPVRYPTGGIIERRYLCRCDCGNETIVWRVSLRQKRTKSCGCFKTDGTNYKHGNSRRKKTTKLYTTWLNMIARCTNPSSHNYSYYGERGIKVCTRWQGEHGFENFLADMGEKPEGLTIERIDNNGNYEPGNCRWATKKEQSQNQRPKRNHRRNVWIEYGGKRMIVQDWALKLGINPNTLRKRLNHWSIEKALNEPVRRVA